MRWAWHGQSVEIVNVGNYCLLDGLILAAAPSASSLRPIRVNLVRLACCRTSPPELARAVPAACGTVWNVIRAQGTQGIVVAGRHVAVYLDDQINLEVGVELASTFVGDGEVVSSTISSGAVATAVHFGPYNRLGNTRQSAGGARNTVTN
jgi:hypothetical protein